MRTLVGALGDIVKPVAVMVVVLLAGAGIGAAMSESPTDKAVAAWKADHCQVLRVEKKQTCSLCQQKYFPLEESRAPITERPTWRALTAKLGGADAILRGVEVCE